MKKILIVTRTSTDTISACAYNLYNALKNDGRYDIYVYSIDERNSYSYPFEKVFPCPVETRGMRGKMAIIKNLRQVKKDLSIDCSISTLTAFTAYNVLSSWHDAKYTLGYFITKLRNGIIVTGSHFMYIAYLYMLSYSVFFCRGSFFGAFKGIIWSALAFYLVNKIVVKK